MRQSVVLPIRFAPLQGETFIRMLPEEVRAGLPDSLVVRTETGALLTRSAAVLHVLRRLGGLWWLFVALGRCIPMRLRDAAFAAVARRRRPSSGVCSILPADLRARFAP